MHMNKLHNLLPPVKVEKPPGLSDLSAGEKVSIKQVENRRGTKGGRLRVLVDPQESPHLLVNASACKLLSLGKTWLFNVKKVFVNSSLVTLPRAKCIKQ